MASNPPEVTVLTDAQKDGSQETVISLLGMLTGSLVVSSVTSKLATWITLLLLLSIHLYMNYMAVRAVSMRSLNRQRANIVLDHLITNDVVLKPPEASQRERIFEQDGVIRNDRGHTLGTCAIGVRLQALVRCLKPERTVTGATVLKGTALADVMDVFKNEAYLLWYERDHTVIVLKADSTTQDGLKAWYHALLLARRPGRRGPSTSADDKESENDHNSRKVHHVKTTLHIAQKTFDAYVRRLVEAGWDLNTAALETKSGTRCVCDYAKESSSTKLRAEL